MLHVSPRLHRINRNEAHEACALIGSPLHMYRDAYVPARMRSPGRARLRKPGIGVPHSDTPHMNVPLGPPAPSDAGFTSVGTSICRLSLAQIHHKLPYPRSGLSEPFLLTA
jgi:hypothetical protein